MDLLPRRGRSIGILLPQIARNLRIAALVDSVRRGLTLAQVTILRCIALVSQPLLTNSVAR